MGMRTNHFFLIESDSSGHRLSVDGDEGGTFTTLCAAEAKAIHIAQSYLPSATLRFELDFKWTLSDFEIRAATLEVPQLAHAEKSYVDR
jgi:hypothetical protein